MTVIFELQTLTYWSVQISYQSVRKSHTYTLKLESMHPFMAVINNSLVLSRTTNRPHSPINEPKTIVQGSSSGRYCITVILKCGWIENCRIPVEYAVAVISVNIIKHLIAHHTQHRNWPTKAWDKVAVSTGIRQPLQQNAKSFNATRN